MISSTKHLSILVLFLLCSGMNGYGQEKELNEVGAISYISIESYYLRFATTAQIEVGDTIYIKKSGITANGESFSIKVYEPMFVVNSKSSTSALCTALKPNSLALKTQVYSFRYSKKESNKIEEEEEPIKDTLVPDPKLEKKKKIADSLAENTTERKELISGRVVLSNDAIFSSQNSSQSRFGGRISFGVKNIAKSRLSFNSYIAYNHYFRSKNLKNAPAYFLGVYQLSVLYEGKKDLKITLGRAINNNLSSIGAIDGIQIEKQLKRVFFGVASGFRPNYQNYSLDFSLYQTGAYVGFKKSAQMYNLQSTVGFMDQRNNGKTDRRYLAMQHSITLRSNFNVFGSMEMDLYQKRSNGLEINQLNFTSLYVSMNYRFSRKLSGFLAYDNRRNIIFYQSYFDILDNLLENQYVRQIWRVRASYKLSKQLTFNVASNIRLNKNESFYNNFQGSVYWNRVFKIGGTLSYRFNYNNAIYMKNTIHAIRYQRNLSKWDGSYGVYYRLLKYNYTSSSARNPYQHFTGAELTKNFKKNLSLSGNVEFYNQKFHNTFRFNVRLTKSIK